MMNFSKKREEKTISFFNAERCRKKEKKSMMIFEPLITAVATVAPSPFVQVWRVDGDEQSQRYWYGHPEEFDRKPSEDRVIQWGDTE
jgi:hypothetical protein